MATTWKQEEISALAADYEELAHIKSDAVTKYNPTPGAPPASLVLPSFCPHSLPPNNNLALVLAWSAKGGKGG